MIKDNERFKSISNRGVSENGGAGQLTLTREDGTSLHLRLYKEDFITVIDELTQLAIETAAIRTGNQTTPIPDNPAFRTIEVNELAIARSDDGNHLFLVLRFFDFDLSYKVGLEDLKAIADGFAQTAAILEAEQASIADGPNPLDPNAR